MIYVLAENYTSVCTIHEVRVNPCREAEERKPCTLKKGRNASISFDYTTGKYNILYAWFILK